MKITTRVMVMTVLHENELPFDQTTDLISKVIERFPYHPTRSSITQALDKLIHSKYVLVDHREGLAKRTNIRINMEMFDTYRKDVLYQTAHKMDIVAVATPAPPREEFRELVYTQEDKILTLTHQNHELKAIIAEMEPFLRQIDVFEFIVKGRNL